MWTLNDFCQQAGKGGFTPLTYTRVVTQHVYLQFLELNDT